MHCPKDVLTDVGKNVSFPYSWGDVKTNITHNLTGHQSLYSLISNSLDSRHLLDPVPEGRDPGVGRGSVGEAAALSEGRDTSQLTVADTWATRVSLRVKDGKN